MTLGADISGSSTSTGSFGLVLQNGNELSTFLGDREQKLSSVVQLLQPVRLVMVNLLRL